MSESFEVECSVCGKRLRGTLGVNPRDVWVRKHNNPEGKPCWGSHKSNHGHVAALRAAAGDEVTP